jgi:transposase
VDHTRDAGGTAHARLLGLVPGRSGTAYADWLPDRGVGLTAGIRTAALNSFRGYANGIRDEWKLGSAMVHEVHRRVQQDTVGWFLGWGLNAGEPPECLWRLSTVMFVRR